MADFHAPLDVLVVDDEPLIRWAISRTLAAAGHHVSEAADGASAIEVLSRATPDVVLLDYRLPDTRGLSLLAWIRRLVPSAAVVMMTADQTPEMAAQAAALGAFDVIQKPFDVGDIEPALLRAQASSGSEPRVH